MKIRLSLVFSLLTLTSCANNYIELENDKKLYIANNELRTHAISISKDGELLDSRFSQNHGSKQLIPNTKIIISNNQEANKDIIDSMHSICKKKYIQEHEGRYITDMISMYFCNITESIYKFSTLSKDEKKSLEITCKDNKKLEILLYIHGGLNTTKDSINRAYTKSADIKKSCIYPIFINWKSGPFTTYNDHLSRIRQGEISDSAIFTSPVYLLTDLANSIINTPKSWAVVGSNSFNSTIGANYTKYQSPDSETDDSKEESQPYVFYTNNDSEFSSIGRSSLWFLTSPIKIFTTPFAYTLPKPAWDMMLRRTNTQFITPSDFTSFKIINPSNSNNTGNIKPAGNKKPNIRNGRGILTEFITFLSDHLNDNKLYKDKEIEVTVIGHSMGAIVVNKLISIKHDLKIKNIIHLASADSIENLFTSVVPYLRDNPNTHFYSLSLHPENENREVTWKGALPSGSLLVWIDEMYTTPESILGKRSGRWDKMERTLKLIPKDKQIAERMHFKIYGINEANSAKGIIKSPQKHGEFGDTEFWLKETWWTDSNN
ncbi:hypothetical protein C9J01_08180 [Photobacterium rosenbergii]|uniref:Alpha/beta hydrolase n=1 Tax=Photobacterium rosenbergii TaxID=294936 RepID=A0A2T3NHA6_9GAMM|nr:hypothetical protein [Photobacterium rosenbergii]PSW14406.1 hypothetical protein C9J01_08180 [Photobacterium rosenbergii]